jgi:predicted small lipoprotein YifL
MSGRRLFRFLFLAVLTAVSGCGAKPPAELPTFPVTGKITVDGKPPVRAEVRLRPQTPLQDPIKRSLEPYAYVEEDGTFHVSTYRNIDGAPLGKYAVLIVWPEVKIDGGEEVFGPDRLQGRYGNPAAPVMTFEVQDASNLIPDIDLKLP